MSKRQLKTVNYKEDSGTESDGGEEEEQQYFPSSETQNYALEEEEEDYSQNIAEKKEETPKKGTKRGKSSSTSDDEEEDSESPIRVKKRVNVLLSDDSDDEDKEEEVPQLIDLDEDYNFNSNNNNDNNNIETGGGDDDSAEDDDSGLNASDNFDRTSGQNTNRLCAVCKDDYDVGLRYSVYCCQKCQTFYKNNKANRQHLVCKNGGHCRITKGSSSRKDCTKCRLEKCFSVGMGSKELKLRIDEESGTFSCNNQTRCKCCSAVAGKKDVIMFLNDVREVNLVKERNKWFSCRSIRVFYSLFCSKCGDFHYVGTTTASLLVRLTRHRTELNSRVNLQRKKDLLEMQISQNGRNKKLSNKLEDVNKEIGEWERRNAGGLATFYHHFLSQDHMDNCEVWMQVTVIEEITVGPPNATAFHPEVYAREQELAKELHACNAKIYGPPKHRDDNNNEDGNDNNVNNISGAHADAPSPLNLPSTSHTTTTITSIRLPSSAESKLAVVSKLLNRQWELENELKEMKKKETEKLQEVEEIKLKLQELCPSHEASTSNSEPKD